MQFSKAFITFISIATLAIAAPLSGFRDVINAINDVGQAIATLHHDVDQLGKPGFNMMSMVNDNQVIIAGLDRIARDAMNVKAFTSAEAADTIAVVGKLADEVIQVSKRFIEMKAAIPAMLHGVIVKDLRTIVTHAKATGDILVGDCPADKKAEAAEVYGQIALSLGKTVTEFS
ncbi:hypothetical protein P691DRAFT_784114 [Macrolepiota fuliginosa MF-IS2]|uniref:Cell wall galactomannoprotein n=1 Tax=Macrolepiota fuliginosa MF-IS2 TaxID=1400762 RepID=A0A9P5XAE8_9AGAR|nr:hypothetical protein P691DRAFT_784114 [Macrolepiota fuliginosa MF-IS2]